MAPLGLPLPWKIEASQSLFRLMGSSSLLRYVRWVSSGSAEICPFSHSKTCLSTTLPVFNPNEWFYTFSKATAIEKMTTCADRCLMIIVIFVFSVLLHFKTRCDSVHSVDSFRPEIQTCLESVFLHDLCSQSDCLGCSHPCSKQAEKESC